MIPTRNVLKMQLDFAPHLTLVLDPGVMVPEGGDVWD